MTINQKVEVEHKGNVYNGRISKIVNEGSAVVSWKFKVGRDFCKYNVLYTREQIEKGRVRYESAIAK